MTEPIEFEGRIGFSPADLVRMQGQLHDAFARGGSQAGQVLFQRIGTASSQAANQLSKTFLSQIAKNLNAQASTVAAAGRKVGQAAAAGTTQAANANTALIVSNNRVKVSENEKAVAVVNSGAKIVSSKEKTLQETIKTDREGIRSARALVDSERQLEGRRVSQQTSFHANSIRREVAYLRERVQNNASQGRKEEIEERASQSRRTNRSGAFYSASLISLQNFLNRRRDRLQSGLKQEEIKLSDSLRRQQEIQQRSSQGVLGGVTGRGLGGGIAIGASIAGAGLSLNSLNSTAEDFDTNMKVIGATLGLTQVQLDRVSKSAIALGQDITLPGVSSADAVAAIKQLIFSGLDLESVLGGAAKSSLLLSRVLDVDQTTAIKGVSAALNVFGVESKNAASAVDTIFNGLLRSGRPEEVESFINAIARGGANFAQFGKQSATADVTLRNFVGTISLLNKQGVSGERAGTGLSRFIDQARITFDELGKADKEIAKPFFETIGFGASVLFDSNKKARTYEDSIRTLQKGLKAFTNESDRAQFITAIFGTEADDTVRALANLDDATIKGIGSLDGFVNAGAVAAKQNDNIRGAIDALVATIETKYTTVTAKARDRTKELIVQFTTLTDKLLNGGGIFADIRLGLSGAAEGLKLVLAAKAGFEILKLIPPVLGLIATPAGIFATAIIGGATAFKILTEKSSDFAAKSDEIKAKIIDIGKAVGGVAVSLLTLDFAGAGQKIGRIFSDIEASPIVQSISDAVVKGFQVAVPLIPGIIEAGLRGAGTLVSRFILDPINNALNNINVGAVLSGIFEVSRGIAKALSESIAKVITSREFLTVIGGLAAALGTALAGAGIGLVQGILDALNQNKSEIVSLITDVFKLAFGQAVKFVISNPLALLGTALVAVFAGAKVIGAINQFRLKAGDAIGLLRGAAGGNINTGQFLDARSERRTGNLQNQRLINESPIVGRLALGVNGVASTVNSIKDFSAKASSAFTSASRSARLYAVELSTADGRQALLGRTAVGAKNLITGAFDSVTGKVTSFGDSFRNPETRAQAAQKAIGVATTAIGGYFSGLQIASDDAQTKVIGLLGAATSIGTAFAVGGPVGGAIAAGATLVGYLSAQFDKAGKAAQQAQARTAEYANQLKNGATQADLINEKISAAFDKDPILLEAFSRLAKEGQIRQITEDIAKGGDAADKAKEQLRVLNNQVLSIYGDTDNNRRILSQFAEDVYTTANEAADAQEQLGQKTKLLADKDLRTSNLVNSLKELAVTTRENVTAALQGALDKARELAGIVISNARLDITFNRNVSDLQNLGSENGQPLLTAENILSDSAKTSILDAFDTIQAKVENLQKDGKTSATEIQKAYDDLKNNVLTAVPEQARDKAKEFLDGVSGQYEVTIKLNADLQNAAEIARQVQNAITNQAKASLADKKDLASGGSAPKKNAFGGIYDRPTYAYLGEDGTDVVLPRDKPARARMLARESGILNILRDQPTGGSQGMSNQFNITSTEPVRTAKEVVRELRAARQRQGVR